MHRAKPPAQLQTHERLWALSRRLYRAGWPRLARVVKGINFYLHHALLPPEAEVGQDVKLEHYGHGVVMHPNVKIGNRVRIYHGVTIAAEVPIGSPVGVELADDTMIGAGAVLIARAGKGLLIGAGAKVGAGAVVTRDVLPRQTVVGSPARPIEPAVSPNQEAPQPDEHP